MSRYSTEITGMRVKSVIVATAVLWLSGCAGQHDGIVNRTGLPAIDVEATDLNGDGAVDRDEFNERLKYLFTRRDSDGDESITPAELPDVKPAAYQEADRNADGRLSRDEYYRLKGFDFEALDLDDDEILYSREILRW